MRDTLLEFKNLVTQFRTEGTVVKAVNGISFTLLDIRKTYEALIYDLKNKKGLIYPKKGN